MEIKIDSQEYNALLERKEIRFTINHVGEPTPKLTDVRTKLAAMMNVEPTLMIVDRLRTYYSANETKGIGKLYDKEEIMKEVELPHKILKNNPEAKKDRADKKAEEKKVEEKKTEEKTSEIK